MKLNLKIILFSAQLFALILAGGCRTEPLYRDKRIIMGTYLEIISNDKNAVQLAFNEIKRIEGLLSKYDPESEIAKLNRTGQINPSPETLFVIKKAKEFYSLTDGAFDITVGPLLDLWGFTKKDFRLPSEKEIKSILKLVGMDKLIIDEKKNIIKFKTKGMKVDLGAIAKGYAVDCAISKIKKEGIKNCLINAGGDIYCLGKKFSKPWTVGIKDPRHQGLLENIRLHDAAIATSGDYEQFFIKDEQRFNHIFNPKTGKPVQTDIASVTIIAVDCLTADAMATTAFVIGKEKALTLSKRLESITAIKIIELKKCIK